MQDPLTARDYIRVHVFVSGRVQGVGYRIATKDAAVALQLSGWVKNLPDGRVEAVFEGPKQSIEAMLKWCQQGPSAAVARDLSVKYETPEGLTDFHIAR
ncbi:MAG: acylphosphatase [Cyanothece sp. SIO1E1]|nr:acylphosphatase [Cyanothece sp. SIO1E1]